MLAANETRAKFKLSWAAGDRGTDEAELRTAVGRLGIYELISKDGLVSAYHYPNGVGKPIVLLAPKGSWRGTYRASVEHNKEGLI